MNANQKLAQRVLSMEGAAISTGDPKVLHEWSLLHEGCAVGEADYPSVRDFETRLKNMKRTNNLDANLPEAARRLVLPEPGQPSPDSELAELEKAASECAGFWVGRGPVLKL